MHTYSTQDYAHFFNYVILIFIYLSEISFLQFPLSQASHAPLQIDFPPTEVDQTRKEKDSHECQDTQHDIAQFDDLWILLQGNSLLALDRLERE